MPISKAEFIEAISKYLSQRTSSASSDFSEFCICRGKQVAMLEKSWLFCWKRGSTRSSTETARGIYDLHPIIIPLFLFINTIVTLLLELAGGKIFFAKDKTRISACSVNVGART